MPKNIPAQVLYSACAAGDAAAVRRLLPAGGTQLNLNGPRFQSAADKSTPFVVAANGGHAEIVRMILELAPNTTVDYVATHGVTALMRMAQYHHADILRLLADRGANLNFEVGSPLRAAVTSFHPDDDSRAPDHDGARQLATVRALLRLGAGTLLLRPPPLRHPPRNPF